MEEKNNKRPDIAILELMRGNKPLEENYQKVKDWARDNGILLSKAIELAFQQFVDSAIDGGNKDGGDKNTG